MTRGDWIVAACKGFATFVPSKRQAGAVALVAGIGSTELEGAEARIPPEPGRRHLVGRDAVAKAAARFRVTVRTREPKGAAPVGFVAKFIRAPLDDSEILPVLRKGREARWQQVIGPRLL